MKKIFSLSSLLFSFFILSQTRALAQCPIINNSSITASPDTVVGCSTPCVTISVANQATTLVSTRAYAVANIGYSSMPTTGTQVIANQDDVWSSSIPIPFDFCYYGTKYNRCTIGANGQVCFVGNSGGGNPWAMSGGLPGGVGNVANQNMCVNNSILAPYYDMNPGLGGTITYATYGTAPCRKFVVSWNNIPLFQCTSLQGNQQVVLYESLNWIDINIGSKPACPGWNGGNAITGIVNNVASGAYLTAPGENGGNWTATNQSWRFTPVAPPTWTYEWFDASGNIISTAPSVVVCPTVTTTYSLRGKAESQCDSVIVWDNVTVRVDTGGVPHISNNTQINIDYCGLCDGVVKLYGIDPGHSDTVIYTKNGVPQRPIVTTTGPDSIITISGLCAGSYDFYVKWVCPSNTVSANLPMPPPTQANFTSVTHLGCSGDSVMLTNITAPSIFHSYWDYGDGSGIDSSHVSPLHIYYDNPGYIGTYTLTLTYNTSYDPACATTFQEVINFNHPIDAHITILPDSSVCLTTDQVFYGNSISHDKPVYTWSFGDNSAPQTGNITASTAIGTDSVSYTYPMAGDHTTTLTVTDSIGCKVYAYENTRAVSISVRTTINDTSVCLKDSMLMHAIVNVIPNYISYSGRWSPVHNLGDTSFNGSGDGVYPVKYFGLGDEIYMITVTTTNPATLPLACQDTATEGVHSYPPIKLTNVTASQTIPWGSSIQLNSKGALYYTWTPNNGTLDNPNINNPIAVPIDSVTNYVVFGISLYGCTDVDTITIKMIPTNEAVPSAFTPNGDGLNDRFRVTNMTFQKLLDFRVYNRWGQMVFETNDREIGWDGTWQGVPQDLGVYSYMIIVGLVDGTTKTYTGNVTLIR